MKTHYCRDIVVIIVKLGPYYMYTYITIDKIVPTALLLQALVVILHLMYRRPSELHFRQPIVE